MKQANIIKLENKINNDYNNITGIVVLKNGDTLYENYFNDCTPNSTIHVYSVTKSIISVLIGIAIDKGLIKNIDQKVLEFFPDYIVKKREETIYNVTIKDLITMTATYKYKNPPYIRYFSNDDWAKFSLDLLGGSELIGDFRYTPLIGPDILSAILVKATGKSVFDFATENLFSPLGIIVEKSLILKSANDQLKFNKATNISGWVSDATGLNAAGWGLTLKPMDMAKIGQLYLNAGVYDGKKIVSTEWIDDSTKEHSKWKEFNLSYGYLWWVDDDGFSAMGDGGNVIYVNKKRSIVVSITSLFKQNVMDRIDFIKEYVEPILED